MLFRSRLVAIGNLKEAANEGYGCEEMKDARSMSSTIYLQEIRNTNYFVDVQRLKVIIIFHGISIWKLWSTVHAPESDK